MPSSAPSPLVGIVMGSASDWPTMRHAADVLTELGVPHESRVVSAHRTPELLREYARGAEGRGLRALIAGAGGAAHLPGMLAAWTALPVLGVPVKSRVLAGVDSLLSIVQMPAGVPVATLAIGEAGARNAGLFAARMLAHDDADLRQGLESYRAAQEQQVRAVCGLPLGSTERAVPAAAMANLLGDLWQDGEPHWASALHDPEVRLHLYGKSEPRPGRKMGHLTVSAATVEEAERRALAARKAVTRHSEEAVCTGS